MVTNRLPESKVKVTLCNAPAIGIQFEGTAILACLGNSTSKLSQTNWKQTKKYFFHTSI
jgi:hypothetical protein